MGIFSRIKAAGQSLFGTAPNPADKATENDRGIMLAHVPSVLTSDHLNELRHFKSWVFVGVDAIGKQWEQSEWSVFDDSWQRERGLLSKAFDTQAKKRTPAKNHPIARLLKRPNKFKSRREFLYQVAVQIRLTGACLIWDVRDQYGDPCEMWVIPRGWIWPMPPTPQYPLGCWRVTPILSAATGWYNSLPGTMAGGFYLDVRETIQVGRSHPLYPGEAMSPLEACSQLLDIMFQTDTATWSSFVNSIKPSMLVSIVTDGASGLPITDDQIEQVRTELTAVYAGAQNAGKFAIGNNVGMQPIQTAPAELDYVNGRDQNRNNTLAIQGVPPIAVGLDSDGTYSGSAAKLNAMSELVIQPDLSLFADKITHHYGDLYGEDFEVEGNAKRYDDPTLKLQIAEKVATGFDKRVFTYNEYRAVLDHEPIPDGDRMMDPDMGAMKSSGAFTPDEIRETVDYEPLPDGSGATIQQPQQVGPDGQPLPGGQDTQQSPDESFDLGVDGLPDEQTPDESTPDFDLTPTLGDDNTTGVRDPSRQQANGDQIPSRIKVLLNGRHK